MSYGFGKDKGKMYCSKCGLENIPVVVNQDSRCGGDYVFIYEAYSKCGNEETSYYYDIYDDEPIYNDIYNGDSVEIQQMLDEKGNNR
ncbi:MAG: hypothetical protein FWH29_00325 [Methanobrevibacter sp.]|nr:hypothetical protein [Methanobrevibacter sp.]